MKSTLTAFAHFAETKTLAAALLGSALAMAPAVAQTGAQHEGHHPGEPAAAAPAQATPAAPPAAKPDALGMPMMNMTRGGMDMAGMMRMMIMMHPSMGASDGMGAFDRIEGRIAFLRAELRISDAQAPAWNTFADALRAYAQKLRQAVAADQSVQPNGPAFLDRLDRQERWLSARIEGVRAIRAALTPLFGVLSDEQKKTADELLGALFGMPAMGAGMTGGGMMGGFGMTSGGMMQGGTKPGAGMPGMGR